RKPGPARAHVLASFLPGDLMNPHPPTAVTAQSPGLAPPSLGPAHFEGNPKMQQLEVSRLPGTSPGSDWRTLFLDNPLWPRLGKHWPVAWVLLDGAGRVAGSLTNIPSCYRFRGRELIAANGRAWAIAPDYRGFALWPMDEYFNQPGVDLFINTTVG